MMIRMPIEKPNQGYKPRTLQEIFREMPEMEIPAEMANARRERSQTVANDLSKSISILNQYANYPDSMRILEENNLRPLTYKEVFAILTENEEIKEQLRDKWFWLAGKGSDKNGYYHFDGNDLVKGRVDDIEKNVKCWKGEQPLLFEVHTDAAARNYGRRFDIYAGGRSGGFALAVVGVPK